MGERYCDVVMLNPKFIQNVAAAYRACACYGVRRFFHTGTRAVVTDDERIPRELRMRDYKHVERQGDRNFLWPEVCEQGIIPVAVENRESAQSLVDFDHPEKALYVFGPEDGAINSGVLRHCHRFVRIPTRHSMNVSGAIYTVLYDRLAKEGK